MVLRWRFGVSVRAPGGKPGQPYPRRRSRDDPRASAPASARLSLGDRRGSFTPGQPDALFGTTGYLLESVNVAQRNPATNVAPVTAHLIPLVQSLSLNPLDGTLLRRSAPALFEGLARRPVSGDRWGPASADGSTPTRRARAPYSEFPQPLCLQSDCSSAIQPEYTFTSSEPEIANFVEQDPNSTNLRKPLQDSAGHVIPDPKSGILCAFNAGTTVVTISAGGLSYSVPVTVLGRQRRAALRQPCHAGRGPLRESVASGYRVRGPRVAASAGPRARPRADRAPSATGARDPGATGQAGGQAAPAGRRAAVRAAAAPAAERGAGDPAAPPGAFARPDPAWRRGRAGVRRKKEEEEATEQSQAFAAYRAADYRGLPVAARAYTGPGGGRPLLPPPCICTAPRRARRGGGATLSLGPKRRGRRIETAYATADAHSTRVQADRAHPITQTPTPQEATTMSERSFISATPVRPRWRSRSSRSSPRPRVSPMRRGARS